MQSSSNTCDLQDLTNKVINCTSCELHKTRKQAVISRGNSIANIMLIGEAPGYYEDQQGIPFVGKAGKLLDKMLQAIGLNQKDVYITNIIKCRPPSNRDPQNTEINSCGPFLTKQIKIIKPKAILALGRFAGNFLLKKQLSLGAMRNKTHFLDETPLIITYHPAYLLRNPRDKKKALSDLYKFKITKDA